MIGYGGIQAAAPRLLRGRATGADAALFWDIALMIPPAVIAIGLSPGLLESLGLTLPADGDSILLVGGLLVFGVVFALNSSVHSYLILAYSDADKVALNVGFYYTANAIGRLGGTLLSGVLYQIAGLPGALWASAGLMALAVAFTLPLSRRRTVLP